MLATSTIRRVPARPVRHQPRVTRSHRLPTGVCAASLLALGLLVSPAWAQPTTALERVDEFVRAEMARQKVPGVALAVVRNGEVLRAQGYGLANVEHQVPVRPETVFQSASLGKQFTATAVMLLVEAGKVGLGDPLTRYFPLAPETWRQITVQNLLTHTSGIPEYETGGVIDWQRDFSEDSLAKVAFALKLEFPAGSRWSYSSTGYVLLGIIIHKASGEFYGDLLRERVFGPLGMSTTRIISEADIVPNRAAGYRLVDGELKNQDWVSPSLNTTADGTLYFSILDLIAWDRGLRSGAVLRTESWARVFEPVKLTSGRSYPYGFGWGVEEINGQKVQSHGGAWQGFRTYICRYLGDGLTIAVLANLADANPRRFVDGIAGIMDSTLAPPPEVPIPDREPAISARLRALLATAAQGGLSPAQFAYVRAGFFPETPKRFAAMLRDLGVPDQVQLFERKELGDDRVYRYRVGYGQKSFDVRLGLAPDDRITVLQIWPRP